MLPGVTAPAGGRRLNPPFRCVPDPHGVETGPAPESARPLRSSGRHDRLLLTDRSVNASWRIHDPDPRAGEGLRSRLVRGDDRTARPDRAARLDAGEVPPDAGPPDRPARPLRDH